MKHLQSVALFALAFFLLTLFSCNDPTTIGSDLLAGDQLDVNFTDTLTIRAWSTRQDSIKTYDPNPLSSGYAFFPCGDFLDPIFGRSIARINARLSLNTSPPDFRDVTVDSIVLILPYESKQAYGKFNEVFKLEVRELDEKLPDSTSFFSNREMKLKDAAIGYKEFTAVVSDSVTVMEPKADTVILQKYAAHLRIPLHESFVQAFLAADSAKFASNSAFRDFFKGFQVRPPESSPGNSGLLNFNLRSSLAGFQVYYHKDSTYAQYKFPIFSTDIISAEFRHDYTGAFVQNYLDGSSARNDSLLFMQGMSGLNFDLEIPYIASLGKVVVNRAEIVLPIIRLAEDDPAYDPVDQIIVAEVVNDTVQRTIDDVIYSINRAGDNFSYLFGGIVQSDGTYRINISAHFQDLLTRPETSKKMRFIVYLKQEKASRVVLGGPTHSTQPAKLRLSFTKF